MRLESLTTGWRLRFDADASVGFFGALSSLYWHTDSTGFTRAVLGPRPAGTLSRVYLLFHSKGFALLGEFLFFVWPKKRNQKKRHPIARPSATLRFSPFNENAAELA